MRVSKAHFRNIRKNHELEDRSIEIVYSKKKKERRRKRKKPMTPMTPPSIPTYIIGVPEREDRWKGTEKIFEKNNG